MPFSVWQSVRAAPLATACKTTYSRRISAWNITFSELVAVLEDTIYTRAKRINLRYSHLYQGTEETPGNMEAEWNKLDAFTRYSNVSAGADMGRGVDAASKIYMDPPKRQSSRKRRGLILLLFTGIQVDPTPIVGERAAEAARFLHFSLFYASSFKHSSMEGTDVICGWRSPGSIGLSMFPISR